MAPTNLNLPGDYLDLEQGIFTLAEISKISDCKVENIHRWQRRGFIELGSAKKGKRKTYSVCDAIVIAALNELTKFRLLGLEGAGTFAALIGQRFLHLSKCFDNEPDFEIKELALIGFVENGDPMCVERSFNHTGAVEINHYLVFPADVFALNVYRKCSELIGFFSNNGSIELMDSPTKKHEYLGLPIISMNAMEIFWQDRLNMNEVRGIDKFKPLADLKAELESYNRHARENGWDEI